MRDRLLRHATMPAAARALRALGVAMRRIIGVPDYDAYVAHHARVHRSPPPLTRDEFARDMLVRRARRPGARCC